MKNERILIVDDEAAIREMIAIALDLAGFECLEAEDALAAHALCHAKLHRLSHGSGRGRDL